ncbi:carbon starvation protein A [candidate division KSB1 bacterium]|nr:carbon starvation protein A [bacterium]NUM66267.1 carbon starvation protein A [candidate division KSB1 bacterium]
MNALPIILLALGMYAIAYRYYSAFIAAKILTLDDQRLTPAHRLSDGQNYVPTNKWVLFGHHFAAITGAGPLIGPVLAAQFGFLPGLLWLVIGVCLGGAVHDFIILASSVRHDGKSLAEMARTEIGSVTGIVTAIAILFIIIMALAGLGLAVVNALHDSAWGTFTIATTIPIALLMGLYMYRLRKGKIAEASAIGVVLLILAVVAGRYVSDSSLASFFALPKNEITLAIAVYGFIASILPVWMLLCPRDYLSSYMKIGTIAFLVIGIFVVHPDLKMPALTSFIAGGGPIVPGKLYPFVFITIACGAISGFHALIGSGTTPKMLDQESHARPIGYGAMLIESLVGVTALIAASALHPGDYFAINVPVEKFASLGMSVVNLPELEQQVGEAVAGRTGGAVSLAVGMAQIFTALPGMKNLMAYWYHFAIMFEALFILTTIDTGTRVARFLVQEFFGKFYKPLERADWMPGTILSSALVCAAWAYFIFTGSISQIWPMFGVANQLLAAIALAVGTTMIINAGRARYAWATIVPLAFVGATTLVAGWQSITDNFWPLTRTPALAWQGYVDSALTAIIMLCAVVVFASSLWRWLRVLRRPGTVARTPA